MEKVLRALERRFGRFAFHHVAILLVAPKVAFFMWAIGKPREQFNDAVNKLALVPDLVLQGEAWRLVSFIAVTLDRNPLFFLIYVMLTFLFCRALQHHWGAFRLNVYVLVGWVFVVGGSFVANLLAPGYADMIGLISFEGTLFLGFATIYPNYVFHLFFVLPVKVKWLAWVAILGAVYAFGIGYWDRPEDYAHRVMILAALANYLLFFGPALVRSTHQKQKARSRRREFEDAMRRGHEERERAQREEEEERDRSER